MKTLISAEQAEGLKRGLLIGAAVLVLALPQARLHPPAPGPAPVLQTAAPGTPDAPVIERRLDFGGQAASADVQALAQWVVDSADNGLRPFAIVDKRQAHLYVFEPGGRLHGATPVLLGYAAGDDTVPGIGERPIEAVRPEERTTPAGRFTAAAGRNTLGEDVVWVDYDAAVSMHRVRLTDPRERRAQRLATPTPEDNRISYGCINVPVAFFDEVLWPNFRERGNPVYVLPEIKPLTEVFPALVGRAAGPHS